MAQKGETETGKDKADREHFTYRIPIRMTRGERVLIGRAACALNLSVSRYLVQNATSKRPLKAEDGARLRYLQNLFAKASQSVETLVNLPMVQQGGVLPSQIRDAARLLRELSAELARRLA